MALVDLAAIETVARDEDLVLVLQGLLEDHANPRGMQRRAAQGGSDQRAVHSRLSMEEGGGARAAWRQCMAGHAAAALPATERGQQRCSVMRHAG